MNYFDYVQTAKSGIKIKKSHRGRFTDYCGGKVTEECISKGKHSSDPAVRRMATFAKNARTWKHATGDKISRIGESSFKTKENPVKISDFHYLKNEIKPTSEEDDKKEIKDIKTTEEAGSKRRWSDDVVVTEVTSNESDDDSLEVTSGDLTTSTNEDDHVFSSSHDATSEDVSERQQFAMEYLIASGFTPAGAAGAVGVMTVESGLKPGIVNETAAQRNPTTADKGIFQAQGSRRKAYDQYFKDKEINLENELAYFVQCVKERPLVDNILRTTSNVDDAALAMHLGFENGDAKHMMTPEGMNKIYKPVWKSYGWRDYDFNETHAKRQKYSRDVYNKYMS